MQFRARERDHQQLDHEMWLLAEIVAVLKLLHVGVQVLLRHADVCSTHGAFDLTPEGFDITGVNWPAHVLALA